MENQEKYNTVIFGSSRLYRQFNPEMLDNNFRKQRIKGFNLAAPATHHPEFYFLFENLIENVEKGVLKYAFIELEPLNKIALTNLTTTRNNYWLTPRDIKYANKYVNQSNYPTMIKIRFIMSYTLSYVWKIMGFQNPKQLFGNNDDDKRVLGKNGNGFRTLDEEFIEAKNDNWKKRQDEFLNDTTVIEKRIRKIDKDLTSKTLEEHLNKYHLEKIKELLSLSTKKGIHLIFVIPPKLSEYNELNALKKHLPEQHIIDVSSHNKYPLLYKAENTFDIGHLNEQGASIFTNYVVEEIKRKKIIEEY